MPPVLYIIILTLPGLFGCAGYRLYGQRSFAQEMNRGDDSFWVPNQDFPLSAGDGGASHRSRQEIMARTPSSLQEKAQAKEQSLLSAELVVRESHLSPKELQQYTQIKRELGSLSEKIYYLQLSPGERLEYINMRIPSERRPASMPTASNRDKDISLNMTKEDVVHLWGRPSMIEIAGDPSEQNERWIFIRLRGRRTLYFESGLVRGWTLLD